MQVINIPMEEIFQALSDQTRLRVVRLLAVTGEEACLCELVDSLLEPQYKLSRHLKILRKTGLLDCEKEGRWVYHRLAAPEDTIRKLFELIATLPDAAGLYAADLERFRQRLKHRENGRCRVGVLNKAFDSEVM